MDGCSVCTLAVEITFRLTELLLVVLLFPAADESPGPSLPTNPLQNWCGLRDVILAKEAYALRLSQRVSRRRHDQNSLCTYLGSGGLSDSTAHSTYL
jgi:hypothetical protein